MANRSENADIRQESFAKFEDISALDLKVVPLNRSRWIVRASRTRCRMEAEGSAVPEFANKDASIVGTLT